MSQNLSIEQEVVSLLTHLGVPSSAYSGGDLTVRTPLTGEVIAQLPKITAAAATEAIALGPRGVARMAHRARSPARRTRPPARRRAARRTARPRPPRHHRDRQDPLRRHRRSAGDDRHLHLRRRPLAPARRPHRSLRACETPHDGDLASPRRRRHHLRLQLPRRGLVVERRARAGLRRRRRLEAIGEDAPHRARNAGHLRASRDRSSAASPPASPRCSSATPQSASNSSTPRSSLWSPPPAPPPWAAP